MNKSLQQVQSYQLHYRSIYLRAKIKGKKVLRRHIEKLTRQIIQLQGNSAADI